MNAIHTLNATEQRALEDALDDEYKSHATYRQVIKDFGAVRPFINIVEAEGQHIAALLSLFDTYGVTAPANRWLETAPRYASLHEACLDSIRGERENATLFDRLLKSTVRPEIISVYKALQSASLDRHLPAFQRCAQRAAG